MEKEAWEDYEGKVNYLTCEAERLKKELAGIKDKIAWTKNPAAF